MTWQSILFGKHEAVRRCLMQTLRILQRLQVRSVVPGGQSRPSSPFSWVLVPLYSPFRPKAYPFYS